MGGEGRGGGEAGWGGVGAESLGPQFSSFSLLDSERHSEERRAQSRSPLTPDGLHSQTPPPFGQSKK